MSLVVFDRVSLSAGRKAIVRELDWRIGAGDRIGLIGRNGSGKTTLLRALAHEIGCDAGRIQRARGLRIGYLPQDIALKGGRTLLDFVLSSVPGRDRLEQERSELERELDVLREERDDAHDQDVLIEAAGRLAEVHEKIAHFESHFAEHEALRILSGLGFLSQDATRDLATFSGGWQMRGLLAALLFQKADLLLLDEPTNHLDMPSVAWFSGFLRKYRGAFVLVCHDREFMDRQIDIVASFEPEGMRQYRGNYEHYLRQRAEELEVLTNKARNLAKAREQAEQFITRFRAQANKAKAVQSRIKALERMETIDVDAFRAAEGIRFRFPSLVRSGGEPIRVRNLAKAYGDLSVLSGVSLTVGRGDKIAILGPNGAGKTTLLKLIAREVPADDGTIEYGHQVDVGYYAQHHVETLDPNATAYECVAEIDPAAGPTRIHGALGAMQLGGEDAEKKINVLSGGERARVALARLLVSRANVMLMDEPTNHLDLQSAEALAEALRDYEGTLLFVSHNLGFVRRLATQIWKVGGGNVEIYPGTLDEYLDGYRSLDIESSLVDGETRSGPSSARAPETSADETARDRTTSRARKRKEAELRQLRRARLGPLASRVSALEAEVTRLEAAQAERTEALADGALYQNAELRARVFDEYQKGGRELADAMAAWESAQSELESAEAAFEAECEE